MGAMNFYRPHCKNFTYSSAPLTALLKKNVKWRWGEEDQRSFEELKKKIASMEVLGVPKPIGEIVMVTDSSNIGGGSTIFQWQSLEPQQIPEKFSTFGVCPDGSLKHDYPENFRLVPLGHWNWKWNESRRKYHYWEQELLAAVLTLASQSRIVSNMPIVFYPCQKSITGEGVLKILLETWIAPYGKPLRIHSDNDVRFKQEKGFYQTAFKALGVKVHFSIPRHSASNGLCENKNRRFIQNLRALSLSCKNMNWPQMVPYCTWLMNSQISATTGMSPHEMFLGRPACRFEIVPEPCLNPESHTWLMEQPLI